MDFLFVCHADSNAMVQRDTFLQNGNVKRYRRKCQRYCGIVYIGLRLYIVWVIVHIVHQIPVLNHYTLRLPGRTGSINAVAQVLWADIHLRVLCTAILRQ